MSSTVERVAAIDDVPPAVAVISRTLEQRHGAPNAIAGVCWPEFATLGWSDAGAVDRIAADGRP